MPSPEQLLARFPRASADFIAANSHLDCVGQQEKCKASVVTFGDVVQPKRKAHTPNKTESDFARILQAQMGRGEILSYRFEGLTIRLADDCRYTPDFFVLVDDDPLKIRFCETKGKHVWEDSKIKFRVAKEQNPWAEWEMWQKKGGQWERLL